MKKGMIIVLLAFGSLAGHSQFKSAVLQASGLTCAMCSKAINQSLKELAFVELVKADIKNSSFNILFKSGTAVDIDLLKMAVEEAGFSVAKLKIAGQFQNIAVKNDEHVLINGSTFHFLKVNDQVLDGEKEIVIVDKSFVTAREFRKYSTATQMACVHTGKAGPCCRKEGINGSTRIYHATM